MIQSCSSEDISRRIPIRIDKCYSSRDTSSKLQLQGIMKTSSENHAPATSSCCSSRLICSASLRAFKYRGDRTTGLGVVVSTFFVIGGTGCLAAGGFVGALAALLCLEAADGIAFSSAGASARGITFPSFFDAGRDAGFLVTVGFAIAEGACPFAMGGPVLAAIEPLSLSPESESHFFAGGAPAFAAPSSRLFEVAG